MAATFMGRTVLKLFKWAAILALTILLLRWASSMDRITLMFWTLIGLGLAAYASLRAAIGRAHEAIIRHINMDHR